MIELLLALIIGGSLSFGAWAGRDELNRWFDAIDNDLREKLRLLRVSTQKLRTWLIIWMVFMLTIFVVMWLVFDALVFGITFAALIGYLPWYIIRRKAENRRRKIEDQLADAMVSLSGAIKAGLSLGQALEILAEQLPKPISEEFQVIVGEYQMGKPMDRCLEEARVRLKSENFALFAAAMQASRESGGRLNETVERIATSVLELQRLERKLISETAQARTSAVYMALAPIAVLIMYYFFLDPVNTERLFTTVPGQIMLCLSMIFNLIAYVWARSILHSDI